jgi:F-type H+-transporting ATPase subunit a
MEHEIWFTALLNKLLAGILTPGLKALHVAPADPAHPIPNYLAMEIFVLGLILVGAFLLRRRLSVEAPGKFQQLMETVVVFVHDLAEEIIGHGASRYVALLGTLGIFIVLCNVFGVIPTLETPTGHIEVTLGCAVSAFLYYNYQGFRHHGFLGYMKTFWGPIWWLGFLLFPVELISNTFRLLSLSVRLYANMFAGKLLEESFGVIFPVVLPATMMGLHVFVSFIQAYVFVLLPAVYISLAVSEEH